MAIDTVRRVHDVMSDAMLVRESDGGSEVRRRLGKSSTNLRRQEQTPNSLA